MDNQTEFNEYIKSVYSRLDQALNSNHMKNNFITTILGHGVMLSQFLSVLMERGLPMPHSVKYSMLLLASNFRALSSQEEMGPVQDLGETINWTESYEEEYHRKLKSVIKIIYQTVIEEEKQEEELKRLAESIHDRKEAL